MTALLAVQYWPVALGRFLLPTGFFKVFPALSGSVTRAGLRGQQLTDLTTQQYPWQAFDAASLRHGHIPLWDPHVLMGVPQVASWLPAVFDPAHLGYLVMPTALWWSILFPLRQLVAGLGASLLGRRLTGSRVAGLVAGMMYGLGGFVEGHNGQNQGEVACLLPFLLLAVVWLARRPTFGRSVVTALLLAAMVLMGHPETFLFALVTSVVLAVAYAAGPGRWARRRFAGLLSAAFAMALGFSAVQWIPGLGWLTGSGRLEGALHVHAAAVGLLDFFSRDATSGLNSVGVLLPSAATYLGVAGLFLACFGALDRRRSPVVGALILLALVSGDIAFGGPPLYSLAEAIPGIRGMRLDFLLMVTDMSVALLAAFGMARLRRVDASPAEQRQDVLAYPVIVALSLPALLLLARQSRAGLSAWFSLFHGPLGAGLLVVLAGTLLCPPLARRRVAVALLLALMAVDLSTWSLGYHQFVPADRNPYRTPPVLAAIEKRDPSSDYRTLDVGRTMPLGFALAVGGADPVGYGPYEASTISYWSGLAKEPPGGHLTLLGRPIASSDDRRLQLADVKYVVATTANQSAAQFIDRPQMFRMFLHRGDVFVFRVLGDLGPAFVVPMSGVRVETDPVAAGLLAWRGFRPAAQAIVPSPAVVPAGGSPDATACECVSEFTSTPGRVSFDVAASQASFVVVSQTWYPGWSATVNGRAARASRTDLSLTGLAVPPGNSQVVLVFHPEAMTLGIAVSAASLTLVALALVASRRSWLRRLLERR
jgi:hypothetical protein